MLKLVFDTYTNVVTFILIGIAIFYSFTPDVTFSTGFLWQLLLCSFLTSLGSLLYTESSLKVTIIKGIIHYVWVVAVTIGCGFIFHWFEMKNLPEILSLVGIVTAVFISVSVVSWTQAAKDAIRMNDKLMQYQSQKNIEE